MTIFSCLLAVVYYCTRSYFFIVCLGAASCVNAVTSFFRGAHELEGYLIASGSVYPLTAFTFKKEPIGGPEGAEIVR